MTHSFTYEWAKNLVIRFISTIIEWVCLFQIKTSFAQDIENANFYDIKIKKEVAAKELSFENEMEDDNNNTTKAES